MGSEAKRIYDRAYKEKNREKFVAYQKAYQARNKEKVAAAARARYERDKSRITEYQRAYRAANKEAISGYQKEYRKRNPDARPKGRHRIYRGLPEPTRPQPTMCENEGCRRELVPGKGTHLDHDHATGKFRGWLCNRCNMSLGHFGDNIAGVEKILEYLRRNGST